MSCVNEVANRFVLLYSFMGYAARGTKRALIRCLTAAREIVPETWKLYRTGETAQIEEIRSEPLSSLCRQAQISMEGAVNEESRTFGCDNFSCDFSNVSAEGVYLIAVTFTDGSVQLSHPFPICARPLEDQVLRRLSVQNAKARYAAETEHKGYYDCNNPFGEGYSHGTFLYGLSHYYMQNASLLSEGEKNDLQWAADVAFDYLMCIYREPTGEIGYCAPERPGDPDRNSGLHNSMESILGLSTFFHAFSGIDARVNNENLNRILRTAEYITAQGAEGRWRTAVLCHLYYATGKNELLDEAKKIALRTLADLDYESVYRGSVVSEFEGIWLLGQLDPDLKTNSVFSDRCAVWKKQAGQIVQKSAYRFPGVGGKIDNVNSSYLGFYSTDNGWFWTLNQEVEDIARDACILWELTGDRNFEKIAAGALGYITGLNFGISRDQVTVRNENGGPMACGSFIIHTYGAVEVWQEWGTPMRNQEWASIVNGYTVEKPETAAAENHWTSDRDDYVYSRKDWVHGETFIRMDGMMLAAGSMYENLVNRN